MITELGRELRKLRIDLNERLVDMADRVGKSAAFISAVEVGRKAPPDGFVEMIADEYKLPPEQRGVLQTLADRAKEAITLRPQSILAKDTAGLLARKINHLSDDELKHIKKILEQE